MFESCDPNIKAPSFIHPRDALRIVGSDLFLQQEHERFNRLKATIVFGGALQLAPLFSFFILFFSGLVRDELLLLVQSEVSYC